MTRVEENKMIVDGAIKRAEDQPTGTYEEMVTFQLGLIATMLADKTESDKESERIIFIEFHLLENNKKIKLNIKHIKSFYQIDKETIIYVGMIGYRVKESYEEVAAAINNCISELQGRRE